MRPSYFALLAAALCLAWQVRGFAQTTQSPPPTSNPASLALLDGAIAKLSRPEGVEIKFRLEVFGRAQPVMTSGRAVTAANRKVYIEMSSRQVSPGGAYKLICDGETFYKIESIDGRHALTSYGVKELQEALDRLGSTEAERVAREEVEKLLQGRHGFEGVAALVKDLRGRMDFEAPQVTTATVNGKLAGVKLVQGQWSKDVLDYIAPMQPVGEDPNGPKVRQLWNDKQAPFFNVPRLARFYFDSGTNELLRLELVGIREKQGPEAILTTVHVESVTPLTKLEESQFKPTAAELAYPRMQLDLAAYVRGQHQEMMRQLKRLQDHQNEAATNAGK